MKKAIISNLQTHGRYILIVIFIVLIVYSINRIEVSKRVYIVEQEEHEKFMVYKPKQMDIIETIETIEPIKTIEENDSDEKVDIDETDVPEVEAIIDADVADIIEEEPERLEGEAVNPSILELQEVNQDVVGWVTIPGTQVDYYFLWAKDYETYYRTDINGQYSYAGSIFMDYRCDMNLRGAKTILYGHNMKNNSMFGSLANYKSRSFFTKNKKAHINLPYYNLELELVSCMVVKAYDPVVFGVKEQNVVEEDFIKALKKNNVHGKKYVPKDLSVEDRFVLFSTCNYETKEARTVVVFRILEESVEGMNIRGR